MSDDARAATPPDPPADGASDPDGAGTDGAWLARWFSRLSTGTKLILFMALALTPLGLVALLASLNSARLNTVNREAAGRAQSLESARALDTLIARTALTLRGAGTALGGVAGDARNCRRTLGSLAASHPVPVDLALLGPDGAVRCATAGFSPPRRVAGRDGAWAALSADGEGLDVTVAAADVGATGVARFSRAAIAAVVRPPIIVGGYRLVLHQGDRTMSVGASGSVGDGVERSVPVADGQFSLALTTPRRHVSATEILSILLPIVMLLAAGAAAWLVMDRLMLQPLKQLQRAVLDYRAGQGGFSVPRLTTPAYEIRTLADAFRRTTEIIVHHEVRLEEGIGRQTRLTREVHHRVKNNLQVVASLLSLHARGAPSPEAAEAYAAIQRRVDALAVVHRNHYAELEENRGVALRPLIGELAANLRARAPAAAARMPILLELAPLHAVQDVAVPVAFLLTELVEAAMLRAPAAGVSVRLSGIGPGRAVLAVTTGTLDPVGRTDRPTDEVERVLQGLSRQLRSALVCDNETGTVSIELSVVD